MTAGDIVEKYNWLIRKYTYTNSCGSKTLTKMSMLYTEAKQVLLNEQFDKCNISRLIFQFRSNHLQNQSERKLKKELVDAIFSKIEDGIEVYVDETAQRTIISETKPNRDYDKLFEAAYKSPHKLFPYLYKEISPEDKNFLKALYTNDEDSAAASLEKLMQNLNRQMTKICVKDTFVTPVKTQLETLEEKRETLQNTIAHLFDQINKAYSDLNNVKLSITNIVNQPDKTGDEIVKVLENSNNIFLAPSDTRGEVDVRVEDTLEYFDSELAMRMFMAKSSTLYRNTKIRVDDKQLVTLFAGLFVLRLGKLKVCSQIALTKNLFYCKRIPIVSAGHYPNPHINNYSCLGENSPHINNFLCSGDYDQAIFQILSATKGITLDDAPVFNSFIGDMQTIIQSYSQSKIFLDNDGKEMDIKEFIAYCENHESYKKLLKEAK